MSSIEVSREQQSIVLRYLSRHLAEQPQGNGIRTFKLLPTSDEAAPFVLSLGVGKHLWSHKGLTFTVQISEEGSPCGDVPTYFTRMRLFGEDPASLTALLTEALSFRTPAPPGKIWMSTASRFGHWRESGASPAQSFDDLFLPVTETQEPINYLLGIGAGVIYFFLKIRQAFCVRHCWLASTTSWRVVIATSELVAHTSSASSLRGSLELGRAASSAPSA